MKKTFLLSVAVCMIVFSAAMASAAGLADFRGQTCILQTWGGPWGQSLSKIIAKANKKYGTHIRVLFNENSQIGIAKVRAMRNAPKIDLQMSIVSEAIAAGNEGLISPINASLVPQLRNLRRNARYPGNWFVALYSYPMGLIVRPDKVRRIPTKFSDLWKPEYRNQIALPSIEWAGGHHVIVLAAKMRGGDERHINPGFKALHDLVAKGNVKTFYSTDDGAIRLVQSGEAGIVVSLLPNAVDFLKNGTVKFVYPTDLPVCLSNDVIWVVKGGKEKFANAVINYLLSPEAQLTHSQDIAVLPVNTHLTMPAGIKAWMPPAKAKTFFVNENVCTRAFDTWKARYDKEVIGAK